MKAITADAETLMRQAPMTVANYLADAISEIDKVYGSNYAKLHPELLGAFIQACAVDFQTSVLGAILQETLTDLDERLANAGEGIGREIQSVGGALCETIEQR